MSTRQTNANANDDLIPGEASSGNRISPSSQRNSRRSNSAMSASRTRASTSKEEAEAEIQAGEDDGKEKDAAITAEPEEDGDANENADSGDSANSAAPASGSRSRRKLGGKRRRGGAAGPASRSRAAKESRQANDDDQRGEEEEEEEEEAEEAEATVKVEAGEEKEEDANAMMKSTSDYGEDGMSRTTSKEGTRLTRQRSASGFKELAGLGLRSLGNGEEEPLVPRRTRRGAYSPNEAHVPNVEEDEKRGASGGEALAEDENKPGYEKSSSAKLELTADEGQEASADDETAEEGVTRCLCGSADENVGLMIQCETCKCWQHCICMGMRTEEDCPDVYFCEQCRPELHVDLLRLLGVLPAARSGKKGAGGKTQSGRISAKDAAKELKEAKEAVLSLAKENERRRKEGRDPVTGWSVAQEQEQEQLQMQQMQQGATRSLSSGQHRRQASETQARASRSQSRDELSVPKSPPKRRSTMNSRDSAYGWESIPPGLLNEEEEWTSREDGEGGTRKRKRGGQGEDGERQSLSPVDPSSNDGMSKRRRTSSAIDGNDDEETQEVVEEDDAQAEESAVSSSQTGRKGAAKLRNREQDAGRPKHPNQYTARRAAAAAASTTHTAGGAPGSSSPSPSPSKHRWADEMRKGSSLRDVINNGSRMATPTPGGSQGDFGKATNPGSAWGMPEHLSHLAYLLPTSTGPEPLKVSVASTKGLVTTSNAKGASSTAIKDSNTRRIIQASPQAFQVHSLVEANTKIKFPGKRTTFGEMKKRVRNILDFVSRLQVESAERERRMKFLGISKDVDQAKGEGEVAGENAGSSADTPMEEGSAGDKVGQPSAESAPAPTTTAEAVTDGQDTEMKAEDAAGEGGTTAAAPPVEPTSSGQPSTPADSSSTDTAVPPAAAPANDADTNTLKCFTELHSSSMSLVDELTRELLAFLQRYGAGTSTSVPMASSGSAY